MPPPRNSISKKGLNSFTLVKGVERVDSSTCLQKYAFTLAEVLITLGIIGIVAALTMPALINSYQKMVLKNQFKKVYSTISQAFVKAQADLGYSPGCYWWADGAKLPHKCVSWGDDGFCTKYTLMDGGPLPSDINGSMSECTTFGSAVANNLQIVKTCQNNSFSNKCTPDYLGIDDIKRRTDEGLSDEDLNKAVGGEGAAFYQNALRKGGAYVLADGSIIIFTGSRGTFNPSGFAIDINGMKGPNKWGVDVFTFISASNSSSGPIFLRHGRVNMSDSQAGGVSTLSMIQNMGK